MGSVAPPNLGRYSRPERPGDAEHITIYYDSGYFAGWPFNHGFWSFPDNELVISFSRGACRYERPYDLQHNIVDAVNGEFVTLRSTDAGRTWPVDSLQILGSHGSIERQILSQEAAKPSAPFDWKSPDFCLTAGFGIPPSRSPQVGYVRITSIIRGRPVAAAFGPPAERV